MALWWTKTSGPLCCSIKPKPLLSLNHLTVPVVSFDIFINLFSKTKNPRTAGVLEILDYFIATDVELRVWNCERLASRRKKYTCRIFNVNDCTGNTKVRNWFCGGYLARSSACFGLACEARQMGFLRSAEDHVALPERARHFLLLHGPLGIEADEWARCLVSAQGGAIREQGRSTATP